MKAKTERVKRYRFGVKGGLLHRVKEQDYPGVTLNYTQVSESCVIATDHEAALERCAKVVEAAKEILRITDSLGTDADINYQLSKPGEPSPMESLRTAIKEYEEGL